MWPATRDGGEAMHDWFPPRRHTDPPLDTPLDDIADEQVRRLLMDEARRMRAAVARAKADKESRQVPKEERPTDD